MNEKKMANSKRLSFAEDLIENIPIGMMLLDKNGKIVRMNKKQEEASQIKREKVIGKTFPGAFPRTLEQGLKEPYSKLLNKGVPFDVIIDRYLPQYYSKIITYHARGSPFSSRKYFILLHEHAIELGQEKRLVERRTKELQESKNFLESLIDSSPNIVISTDLSDRILIFNKTAEKTFGYMEEDVVKRKIDFLFKEMPFEMKRSGGNPATLREILCVRKNQTTFPASFRVSDIKNTKGKSVAKLYLLNDLTERKEMQERLFLSEKLALYSELMGGIAHQLNNPLVGVVNFSEMLLKEMEDEDPKRELAQTISRAGKECLRITTSVLNCIKDPHLTFSIIDINEVLLYSLEALKDQFKDSLKGITIIPKISPTIPPLLGDGIQLKQCFLNILTNAIQALQNGIGSITIGSEYDDKRKEVKILFSDTGCGIPKENMNKIFLPFFSLQKAPEKHGLGLSFAYQIIKNHGGNIHVESETGKGSSFTVILSSN
jgi:two-component system NtrC family sensor kinase